MFTNSNNDTDCRSTVGYSGFMLMGLSLTLGVLTYATGFPGPGCIAGSLFHNSSATYEERNCRIAGVLYVCELAIFGAGAAASFFSWVSGKGKNKEVEFDKEKILKYLRELDGEEDDFEDEKVPNDDVNGGLKTSLLKIN